MFFQSMPKLDVIIYNDEMVVKWKNEYQRLIAWQESDNRRNPALSLAVLNQKDLNKKNYTEAEIFLSKLRQNPHLLYNKLRTEILKLLKDFDLKYPAGQSLTVRKALFKLNQKLMRNVPRHRDDDAQNHFINLCRLLWQIQKQLVAENQCSNNAFHAIINAIVESTHVAIDGSLPNELASFRLDSKTEIMPTVKLLENEKNEFMLQAQELKRHITFLENLQHNSFIQARCDLAIEIINELDNQSKHPNFDMKFGATILENTRMLLQQPQNENLQETYAELSAHAAGSSTALKVLSGIMLAALGLGLLFTSLSLLLTAGFGFVVPISTSIIVASCAMLMGSALLADGYLRTGGRQGCSLKMFQLSQSQPVATTMQDDPNVAAGLFRPS